MSKSNQKIYLDFASSFEPNPSSIHEYGVSLRKSLENTRGVVAQFINARPSEIIFTASGTEANNLAVQGILRATTLALPHMIATNIEHPSVLETIRALTERGEITSTIIPVESNGIVDPKKIKSAITDKTILVSVMYANNEIGTIEPIAEIAKAIRHYKKTSGRNNIYFHTDAVQAVNYLPIDVLKLGVDLLTFSGTKVEGSRGVGVLWKRTGINLAPIMYGGDQEFGLRPGTENTKAILNLGKAIRAISKTQAKESKRLALLRDYFFKEINKSKVFKECGVVVNGDLLSRLPNNINITFPKIPSELLVIELSSRGIMTSSKSACKSKEGDGSYVISAIRPEIKEDIGGLRISLGKNITKKELSYTIKSLTNILLKLKGWYH